MNQNELKPIQKLHKVVSKLEIRDVFATETNSKLHTNPHYIKPEQTKIELTQNFKWNLNDKRSILMCSIEKSVCGVSVADIEDFKIKKDEKLFEFIVAFAVVYTLNEDSEDRISDDVFDMFCETNANYNSYPYLREYINSTCTRMNIHPVVLPFMKPYTVKEINEKFSSNLDKKR